MMMMALPFGSWAQGEGNIWTFGYCNSIHFTSSGPVYGGVPGTGVYNSGNLAFSRSNAVCDANGNLLFYVKMKNNPNYPPSTSTPYAGKNIYNALGGPMDNSYLVTAVPVKGPIQIIKKPGNNEEYYVIYSLNQALLSTTVDMSLNGGLGGVVVAEKGVMLSGWQTIVGEKTVVVQGCDCIWLVARSRTANEYKAYRITEAGIDLNPVISVCGLLPLNGYADAQEAPPGGATGSLVGSYGLGLTGLLKASPDGRQIVACCAGGLELYHFSRCSGKLSDARLLDTTSSYDICAPANSCNPVYCHENWPLSYYSACFSPDGSKLYATYFYGRNVYQFNLSLPTTPAIMNSKTIVLSNRVVLESCDGITCDFIDTTGMGDLKLGPDGKIYIGNNTMASCIIFPGQSEYNALHAINAPNLPGLACAPQQEAVILGAVTESKYRTGVDFNPTIVMPPSVMDTITSTRQVTLCFKGLLQADTPGDCYHWNTESDSSSTIADTSGCYIVRWHSEDCTYHIDTFWVHKVSLPLLFVATNSCVNEATGSAFIRNAPNDTSTFTYTWQNASGVILRTATGSTGDTMIGLSPGDYRIAITSTYGCDTVLPFHIDSLPKPPLPYFPDTTVCRGKPIQFDAGPDAVKAFWIFGDGYHSSEEAPLHAYGHPGSYYPAVVVTNNVGCRDTASAEIIVEGLNISLTADKTVLSAGEAVRLSTHGNRPFTIEAWQPASFFPNQSLKQQSASFSKSTVIRVKAVSDLGCTDTTSLEIFVKPGISMPTAFSPNGDGLNDRFMPYINGSRYTITNFQIFNRYGQLVYNKFGPDAVSGWDGTHNGQPAPQGVYYYQIEVSTEYAELLQQKGDVTLVR